MERTMKCLKHVSLVALGLVALGPPILGQGADRFVTGPKIQSITPTRSYDPGPVVIFGENLNTVIRVKVDGVEAPIEVQRTRLLVIWRDNPPAALDPGFVEVEVNALALGRDTGILKLMPTLAAVRRPRDVELVLRMGGAGFFSIFFSTEPLAHPMFLPNTHYMLMLNLKPEVAGKLACGTVYTRGPEGIVHIELPRHIAFAGREFYLQAWTQRGFTLEQRTALSDGGVASWIGRLNDGQQYPEPLTCSFTNMVHITTAPFELAPDRTIDVF
jgi:hypothetical protein